MSIQARWYDRSEAMRLDRDGSLVPVAGNFPVPRQAYRVQHALTQNEQWVLETLEANAKLLPGKLGKVCTISLHDLQKATAKSPRSAGQPMSMATLRVHLNRLRQKHAIVAWDVVASKDSARQQHDGQGVSCYRIPLWNEVLDRWRRDPNIGHTGTKFWVIGHGRRFLTPAELVSWKIDVAAAERLGVKAAVLGATAENLTPEPVATPATAIPQTANAPPPNANAPPAKIHDVSKEVWDAARAHTLHPMPKNRVLHYERKCYEIARAAGEDLTAAEVCAIIAQTATSYRVKRVDIFEAFLGRGNTVVVDQVHAYLDRRVEWRKAEAEYDAKRASRDVEMLPAEQVLDELKRGVG
jgi:hypothetical protein